MSNFNEKSLSLLIGTMTGDQADTLDNLKANLAYAMESRMLHGRDTAFTNGNGKALTQSTQKVTAANRSAVATALALKAGFYAVPVLANFAADFANKAKKEATAVKVDALIKGYITLFVGAYEAALPIPKAVKTDEEKAEAKTQKEAEVQQAAIAYAKDIGMVHEQDIPKAPTLAEYLNSATDAELVAVIAQAQALLDARKAIAKENALKVTERQNAAANAAAATEAQRVIDARIADQDIAGRAAELVGTLSTSQKRNVSAGVKTI